MKRVIPALILSLSCFCFGEINTTIRFEKVTVRPGDTLWGISETYLKNPADWDQILKYNHLPSSDPTVALPGMILRVPVQIMKERHRAGIMVSAVNQVLLRRRETAQWKPAVSGEKLYSEDTLRTLDESKARVRFLNAELLNLEPNSLAVIMLPPLVKQDEIVSLKKGSVFVGHAKVVTAAASITPKTAHTIYSAKVQEDASTLVRVYSGVASVEAQGQSIDLPAGMETTVPPGLSAQFPKKIPHWEEFKAKTEVAMRITGKGNSQKQAGVGGVAEGSVSSSGNAPSGGASLGQAPSGARTASGKLAVKTGSSDGALQDQISQLSIGMPISGFRVQASISRDFSDPVFDKVFDPDEKVDLQGLGLKAGSYWFRLATIDLLGTPTPFTQPRQYSVLP